MKENVRVLFLSNSPSVFVCLSCLHRTVDYIFYGEKNENVKENVRVLSLSQILLRFLCAYPVCIERFITSLMRIKKRGKDPLRKLSLKSLYFKPS